MWDSAAHLILASLGISKKIADWLGVSETAVEFFFYSLGGIITAAAIGIVLRRLLKGSHNIIPIFRNYICRRCNFEDLRHIHEDWTKEFPGGFSSLQDMEKLYKIDGNIYWKIVKRTKQKETPPLGCFAVYRLSAAGKQAVLRGEFNGACPQKGHLAKRHRTSAVYIASIDGSNRVARGAAIAGLTAYLESLGPQFVFGKPITEFGVRLARHHDFRPLKGDFVMNTFYGKELF